VSPRPHRKEEGCAQPEHRGGWAGAPRREVGPQPVPSSLCFRSAAAVCVPRSSSLPGTHADGRARPELPSYREGTLPHQMSGESDAAVLVSQRVSGGATAGSRQVAPVT